MLSSVFVVSVAALLINDFALKRLVPGPITGKISDFVGPVVASLVCVALAETAVRLVAPSKWARPWWFALAAGMTLMLFSLVKLTMPGAHLYLEFTNQVVALAERVTTFVGWGTNSADASVVMDPWDVLVAALSAPVVVWVGVRWRGGHPPCDYFNETVTPPLKSES